MLLALKDVQRGRLQMYRLPEPSFSWHRRLYRSIPIAVGLTRSSRELASLLIARDQPAIDVNPSMHEKDGSGRRYICNDLFETSLNAKQHEYLLSPLSTLLITQGFIDNTWGYATITLSVMMRTDICRPNMESNSTSIKMDEVTG